MDLPITLTAADPSVLTVPAQPVVLPAGQLETVVMVAGTAVGNTTIIVSSARGDGAVVASVSEPVATTLRTEASIVGARLLPIALVGRVFEVANARRTIGLELLSAPAPGPGRRHRQQQLPPSRASTLRSRSRRVEQSASVNISLAWPARRR